MNTEQDYIKELDALLRMGLNLMQETRKERDSSDEKANFVDNHYQQWYTESSAVIKQIIPDRLEEFQQLYRQEIAGSTFTIQEWLLGFRSPNSGKAAEDSANVIMRIFNQYGILESAKAKFKSSLFNIRTLVQADLFDSEIDTARELTRRGFLRAAGAVAGVILEKHLAQVAENHDLKSRKKSPTIGDMNNLLKDNETLDTPTWRAIQRLSDLRNSCVHDKGREPTKEDVDELIGGVEKYIKTLF